MNRKEIFFTLAETLPHKLWYALPSGDVEYFNRRWYEYTGLTFQQSKAQGWIQALHPDDQERTLRAWQQALHSGDPLEIEYRLRNKAGGHRWFLVRSCPARDAQGTITHWCGTYTDIEERKHLEQDLQQREKQAQQVNDLLDSLVHMATHDLKTPIYNISSLLDLFKRTQEPARQAHITQMLERSVHQTKDMLASLEALLRWRQEGEAEPVKLSFTDVLQQVLAGLSMQLEQHPLELRADFHQAEHIHYIEPYLRSMMRNLLSNALKYRCPDRQCIVSLKAEKVEKGVALIISDNGIGIDLEKHRDQLFQSFQRFSEQAEGTGLGLYLVKQMIQHNGGTIAVESQPDQGTTFILQLKEYPPESEG